jgi:glycosyltransferase involved in cell wall biosynthesis
VDVFFVNPDQIGPALAATEAVRSARTYRIGYWFWELPRIPPEWEAALDTVDEIWVASEFVGDAFRQVTDKPVTLVPMVVEPVSPAETPRSRSEPFTFLFSFDFHSYLERKNPRAVVDAFLAAFPSGGEPARLIVKTINGKAFRTELLALMSRASEDRRIEILDGYMSRDAMNELVAKADSYVSLHRAEGFGLGLAESMALGKPVIATAYSGNLAFMNAENSLLVSYRLVDVAPGQYMHGAGQQWAEPDIQDAAAKMRRLVEDRAFAADIGRRAQEYMKNHFSSSVSARAIIERLEAISRSGCLESPKHQDGVRQIHE